MKTCNEQQYIVEYLSGSLDKVTLKAVRNHLVECEVCQSTVRELAPIHHAVKKYRRPQPSRSLRVAYHRELAGLWGDKSAVRLRWREVWEKWVIHPSVAVRFVELALIFIFGLWLGRNWFKATQLQPTIDDSVSIEKQLVQNYLGNVEMLLLDVANLETTDDLRLVLNTINCEHMLQKTELLKDEINLYENPVLANILEELELILLELANCDGDLEQSEIEFIQQVIRDSHIMVEIKTLHSI